MTIIFLLGMGGSKLLYPEIDSGHVLIQILFSFTIVYTITHTIRLLLAQKIDDYILLNLKKEEHLDNSKMLSHPAKLGFGLIGLTLFGALSENWLEPTLMGVSFFGFVIYEVTIKLKSQHLITERGIVQTPSMIEWSDIEEYLWGNDTKAENTTLVLRTKSRWPSFLSYKEMRIPTEYKAAVDNILSQYVHGKEIVD